jgi:hypothetical protein
MGVRLQEDLPPAVHLHDGGAVGLLFRHPQGRALLRRRRLRIAARPRFCHRQAVQLPGHLDGADAAVHNGRDLDLALRRGHIVHLEQFPEVPADWRDDALAAKWAKIKTVRRVITGALEIERREKRIGSSLEAHPVVHVTDPELMAALEGKDMADIAITSQLTLSSDPAPEGAFTLDDTKGVAVVPGACGGHQMRPVLEDPAGSRLQIRIIRM